MTSTAGEPPVTLLTGGRVHTGDGTPGTALVTVGGVITFAGPDGEAAAHAGPGAARVALDGALVTPAFVDAHVHATDTGLTLTGLDLTGCRSGDELLAAVRAAATPGEVLLGHGWDELRWPGRRPPSRAELDAAAGPAAVYLSRVDVHSALVSSAALDLLAAGTDPAALAGWSPDGPVSRDAHHALRRAARAVALTPARRHRAQAVFLAAAAAAGLAAVHECAGPDISGIADLAELRALAAAGGGPRVVPYWGEPARSAEHARELLAATGAHGLAGDLFCDGALGSRTAALREPYADGGGHGARYLDADAIATHLAACTTAGVQGGFHAIGDAALDAVAAGLRAAAERVGVAALTAAGHRIEHVEMADDDHAATLARFGVTASMQPAFDALWGGPDGLYAHRLGAGRAAPMNPFRALRAAGVALAFGSDTPVTRIDPWGAVRAATAHRTRGCGIAGPDAFAAHTVGGWRAAGPGTDPRAGLLVAGAPAHYAVWATERAVPDLPATDPPTCLRTVVAGQVSHDTGELGG